MVWFGLVVPLILNCLFIRRPTDGSTSPETNIPHQFPNLSADGNANSTFKKKSSRNPQLLCKQSAFFVLPLNCPFGRICKSAETPQGGVICVYVTCMCINAGRYRRFAIPVAYAIQGYAVRAFKYQVLGLTQRARWPRCSCWNCRATVKIALKNALVYVNILT